jgi:predicted amino acid racemase
MARILNKLRSRVQKIVGRVDRSQEAITFAEAGQADHAQQVLHEKENHQRPGKLLVVGRESIFNREVIEYALDMAQRLSYEILALNTAPLTCETFNLLPTERSKVCQEFKTLTEKNIKPFQQEAQKRAIPFAHVIKFSEKEQALTEITREFGDIEFVVSDTEEDRAVERVAQGERPKQEIYVYSMV